MSRGLLLAVLATALLPAPARETTPPQPLRIAVTAELGADPWAARSGRYHVVAGPRESFDEGAAARLAGLLVSFESAYGRLWRPLGEPATGGNGIDVYVFGDRRALDRVLSAGAVAVPPFETGGAYVPDAAALLVARETPLARSLEASLLHEASHMLNREILGADLSPWLNEGLAQYCQYSAITDGGDVELGTIAGESVLRVPASDGEVEYRFVPRRSLSYLRGQFKRDPDLSLGPLLDIRSPGPFYGREAQFHYAASWTLVHLLAEGRMRRIGELRPFFFRYAAIESRGGGGRETLLGLLGITLEDLDEAWHRHVKRLG